MASRIQLFDVVTAANTASGTPQTTALDFNDGIVEKLEVVIPPGPSGLVGFRILHSGSAVIPYQSSGWIIADDEKIEWPLEDYPTGSAWAVQWYNADVYDHTLYLRFLMKETQRYQVTTVTPVAIVQTASSAVE